MSMSEPRFMNRFFSAMVIACGLAACAAPPPPPAPDPMIAVRKKAIEEKKRAIKRSERGKVGSVSLTEGFTRQQTGDALFIDARPEYLYRLGHIPGAISVPRVSGDEAIAAHEARFKAALAGKKTFIVYCTGFLCSDARTVANHLAGFGYSSSILEGGWDAWKASDLPTE